MERLQDIINNNRTMHGRPGTILTVDPDSNATAICIADLDIATGSYVVREVLGGGRVKDPVAWQTTHGIAELLRSTLAEREPYELIVAVETQQAGSAFAHDCEPLMRWRHVCAALCEIRGVRCIEVAPISWMRKIAPEAYARGAERGSAKKLYRQRARELVGKKLASNEDKAAAVGIAAWLAAELGCSLRARPEA